MKTESDRSFKLNVLSYSFGVLDPETGKKEKYVIEFENDDDGEVSSISGFFRNGKKYELVSYSEYGVIAE